MRGSALARGTVAGIAMGLAACSAFRVDPPSLHASQTRRLPQLMEHLEALAYARLPQAMDLRQERTRRLRKVARIATSIAESAAQLDGAALDTPLSPSERLVFGEHAAALQHRAEFLAHNVHHLSPSEIRSSVAAIEATCAGCHQRFRPATPQHGGPDPPL